MKFSLGDKVICINGPADTQDVGTVVDTNNVNKVLVQFKDFQDWCKEEWLEHEFDYSFMVRQ